MFRYNYICNKSSFFWFFSLKVHYSFNTKSLFASYTAGSRFSIHKHLHGQPEGRNITGKRPALPLRTPRYWVIPLLLRIQAAETGGGDDDTQTSRHKTKSLFGRTLYDLFDLWFHRTFLRAFCMFLIRQLIDVTNLSLGTTSRNSLKLSMR